MHRFFLPPERLQNHRVELDGPLTHQLARVLRLRVGAQIALLDDSGWEYLVKLDTVASRRVIGHIVSRSQPPTEPALRLVLYQAMLKGKRFESVLQKGTELGVREFVPLITQHCVASFSDTRMQRWRQIVTEAAEQSGRTRLPRVHRAISFDRACQAIPESEVSLLAWVGEQSQALAEVASRVADRTGVVHLFVGPEGGFGAEEVILARESGVMTVSLEPRILRAETAPIVASTCIMAAFGELEPLIPGPILP